MEKGSEAPDCGDYLLAGKGYSHTLVLCASDKTNHRFGSFTGGFDVCRIVQMVGPSEEICPLRFLHLYWDIISFTIFGVLFQCRVEALKRFTRQSLQVN